MIILVTGCAGFIGYHVSQRLLDEGYSVVGIDNLNPYYDPSLKQSRLDRLNRTKFTFRKINLEDAGALSECFDRYAPDLVIHLAAQAGVRYSRENPKAYIDSNLVGFFHMLEECRRTNVKHLIYASSSSVYGANTRMPFAAQDSTEHPLSLYSATKKANELMAHTYSHLYRLPTTGLRFFTIYGPWGRPDMAPFLFTKAILDGKPVQLFNYGNMKRDFTYIDDAVESIVRLLFRAPAPNSAWNGDRPDPASSNAPYKIYNVGNNAPVDLLDFIETIERALGKKAQKELLPLQPGEVPETYAQVKELMEDTGFRPTTTIEEGVGRFVAWYKDYYGVKA